MLTAPKVVFYLAVRLIEPDPDPDPDPVGHDVSALVKLDWTLDGARRLRLRLAYTVVYRSHSNTSVSIGPLLFAYQDISDIW